MASLGKADSRIEADLDAAHSGFYEAVTRFEVDESACDPKQLTANLKLSQLLKAALCSGFSPPRSIVS